MAQYDKSLGVILNHQHARGETITVATKAGVLSTPPISGQLAFATDTQRFMLANGTAWLENATLMIAQAAVPNMGAEQNESRQGYGWDYITDKTIYNSLIGGNSREEEGAIRFTDSTFQAYVDGTWNDIVLGFRFREDSTGSYELEHKPIGFTEWYEVISGNSDNLGLNGLPLTQNYVSSMGAYPRRLIVGGGTF